MSGENESHEERGELQAEAGPTTEDGRRRRLSAREAAFRSEGLLFPGLARALSLKVYETQHYFRHNNLPPENIICGLLLSAFHHNLSSRRFDFIMIDAVNKGYIRRKPEPNTLLWHKRRKELTPVLHQLLGFTSLPFLTRDRGFAVDATNIITDVLLDDGGEKGRGKSSGGKKRKGQKRKWLKLHIMCAIPSIMITSARVTPWTEHEIKYLEPLLADTLALGFNLKSVMADRGYVSKHNIKLIRSIGATPYVTFKNNNRKSKNGTDPDWDEALERFRRREGVDFIPHRERNMAETAHSMMKDRCGDSVRAIDYTGQVNEVLLKVITQNLCRLIHHGLRL